MLTTADGGTALIRRSEELASSIDQLKTMVQQQQQSQRR